MADWQMDYVVLERQATDLRIVPRGRNGDTYPNFKNPEIMHLKPVTPKFKVVHTHARARVQSSIICYWLGR